MLIEEQTSRLNKGFYYLSDNQAKAILELRLHRLTSLERDTIKKDLDTTTKLLEKNEKGPTIDKNDLHQISLLLQKVKDNAAELNPFDEYAVIFKHILQYKTLLLLLFFF